MSTEDRLRNLIGNAGMESRASEAEWDAFARKAHGALLTRRAAAALGTVALIGVVVFAAVALRPTGDTTPPVPPARSPSPTAEGTPVPTGTEEPEVKVETSEQELWFVNGEKLAWSTTVAGGPLRAELANDDPIAQRAAYWIDLLLAGPMGAHQEAGDITLIPEGAQLLGTRRDGDILFVDLSPEFESGGGSMSMQMRLAQIVYTATQFDGIGSVRIMIAGEMVDSIGGEGVIVSEPLTRRDYQDFAPNVVVESPRPADEVSPGDMLSGFANVFEANVSYLVLDEDGKEIGSGFTTATCGTGCWGEFSVELEFTIDAPQPGRVVALTYSAEDGSPQDEVSIPVMLVP